MFDTTSTTTGADQAPAPAERFPVPGSVEDLAALVGELLDHVVLRDAGERAVLHAKLTGGEVPANADEASAGDGAGTE